MKRQLGTLQDQMGEMMDMTEGLDEMVPDEDGLEDQDDG